MQNRNWIAISLFWAIGLVFSPGDARALSGRVYLEGGAGADEARSLLFRGGVTTREEMDFGVRGEQTGASGSQSREVSGSFFGRLSSFVRAGIEGFYRVEPDSVSGFGGRPGMDFELGDSTRLSPGLEWARYSQAGGGGGPGSKAVLYSVAANLSLSQDLGSRVHVFLSGGLYRYSSSPGGFGIQFTKKRRPLVVSTVTRLGTFPENEASAQVTIDLSDSVDVSVGVSRTQDFLTRMKTVSEWVTTSVQWSHRFSNEIQLTSSNTGTRIMTLGVSYSFESKEVAHPSGLEPETL